MRHQVKISHADKRREIRHIIEIVKRCCKYERETINVLKIKTEKKSGFLSGKKNRNILYIHVIQSLVLIIDTL